MLQSLPDFPSQSNSEKNVGVALHPPSFPPSKTFFFICFIFHLGAKLSIQNAISKLPVPSFNPDRDEKPHNNISEASTSSIETISTVLIKEPEETFTKTEESIHEKPIEVYDLKPVTDISEEKSSNNNGMNLQILRVDYFKN